MTMKKSAISLVLLTVASHGCGGHGSDPVPDCGADIVELWVEGDAEATALYEESEEQFQEEWLERVRCLAERGDAESQLKLGIAYRDGSDGPPQNDGEAATWFSRAAEQGHPMAQYNLAILYADGRGVPQDLIMAHVWYDLAASGFDRHDDMRDLAAARRDQIASRLTAADLQRARGLAREFSVNRP